MISAEQKTTPRSEFIASGMLAKFLQLFQEDETSLKQSIKNLQRPEVSALKIIMPNEEIVIEPATGFDAFIFRALNLDPDTCSFELYEEDNLVWPKGK